MKSMISFYSAEACAPGGAAITLGDSVCEIALAAGAGEAQLRCLERDDLILNRGGFPTREVF
jgi:hypothetical protein